MSERHRVSIAAVGAAVMVAGLVGCSYLPSGVPESMATRDGDAVVACRQAVQERLGVPGVDGLGTAVDHVWVGERWHGWYVEGVASASGDTAATDFSCRVAAHETSGPVLRVTDLRVGGCEEAGTDRRCGQPS